MIFLQWLIHLGNQFQNINLALRQFLKIYPQIGNLKISHFPQNNYLCSSL